jgi:hypothetical protein
MGKTTRVTDFKVARKEAFVALANLSDNFQRILREPRRKQKNVPFMHQFVVSNQMFTAHTASLAYYNDNMREKIILPAADLQALVSDVNAHLDRSKLLLEGAPASGIQSAGIQSADIQSAVIQSAVIQSAGQVSNSIMPSSQEPAGTLKTISDQFEIIHTLSRDIEYAVHKYGPKGEHAPTRQPSQ